MRAVTIADGRLVLAERPDPEPGRGELLVRVAAAGLNGADLHQVKGAYPAPPGSPPDIPGLELAGEVIATGPGVFRFAKGDRVMAVVGGGGQAELAVVHERTAIPVPDGLGWPEAGGFPEVVTTAHDALFTQAGLGLGDRLLVHGAAGGVGTAAVQLAAAAGATVVAPGLPEDHDYLRGLGVAEVLDRNGDIAALVRERHPEGVDALADFASRSPEQLGTYAAVVREGGRIASSAGAAGEGPGRTNVMAVPAAATLERLAGLLADGTLRVPIQASYPLAQVDQALKTLGGQHTQGKLAITLP